MSDLFDYLEWRGDITFEEKSFNSIDMLLLSQISYADFDGLISDSFDEKITISKLAKIYKMSPDYEQRNNIGVLISKKTSELLMKCAKTKRFKNIEVCRFVTKFNEENIEQFAAVTFLTKNDVIISYRGTDDSIVGWQEDLNLSWLNQIPSQKDALEYFNETATFFSENIVLIGHSKGGNLAVNTSVNCGEKLQKRISKIYNFDGPGFQKTFFEQKEYLNIERKIYSYYPELSIVGMIFEHPQKYKIIKSTGFAIFQHDAVTWQLLGNRFILSKKFDKVSILFYSAFNEWVNGLSIEDRKRFIKALFEVLESSGAKTLTDLSKTAITSSAKMLASFTSMNKETRKEVLRIINLFRIALIKEIPFLRVFDIKRIE